MAEFQGKDYLLANKIGKDLYHHHAAQMPIFDFHCHLPVQEIYEDKKFSSLTECWIGAHGFGDHYKWRLLREFGVDERYITGDADDHEKFLKYAEIMPYLVGNPIYEWTHLELKHFFNIQEVLSPKTAEDIYQKANVILKDLSARKMMEISNVDTVFTTDDPVDDLHYHELLTQDESFKIHVYPCLRPDKAINVERNTFIPWVASLEKVTGHSLSSLQEMLDALDERVAYFVKHGCVATDHALDVIHYRKGTYEEANRIYAKGLQGLAITSEEEDTYKGYLLVHLGRLYHHYNLVQQYHIGALRNVSSRAYKQMGPDTGYDAVEDETVSKKLQGLLDELASNDELPKTVFYTLNPKDYIVLVALMNGFQGGIRGKMQLGTSWWFNDHYDGMREQLQYLSEDGLLSCFIGMLTDSRSFLSYPRHDYFRRELCSYLGELVEKGRYPDDREILGKIVEDISFNNAKNYFRR